MPTISWLHLSDLHACRPRHGWDAGRVIDTLTDDLRRLQADHELRPDLIFFTGDLAFGQIGDEGERTVAGQLETAGDVLDSVRAAFAPAVAPENVFIVPGNHDVNRREVTADQTEWLDARIEKKEGLAPVRAMVHDGGKQWRRFMERLDAYRDFLERRGLAHLLDDGFDGTTHADPSRLIYAAQRDVGDLRVGVAGFNTAWSCCRDGERGRLWMAGRWQQGALHPGLRGADFSIALMHHPPDWLVEYENPDFGRGLEHDFKFSLHGHEHRAWVLSADGYSVIASAACHEWSEGENNGYNFVRLDTESGRGEVWLRRYDAAGGGWIPRIIHRKTDDRGVWTLKLDWLRQLGHKKTGQVPDVGPPDPAEAGPTEGAPEPVAQDHEPSDLERYVQRLRALNRDLPIAGFETRVRLPIQVSEVYIPLRARVSGVMGDRVFGAQRELDVLGEGLDRTVDFDQALTLARERDLGGVVVLGDPGSGKTTLLKHFVLAASDAMIGPAALGLPADTVPVLIELRRLADPAAGLRAALEESVARTDPALDAAEFARDLCRRPLLVLVDGLDEVADNEQRAAVSRWLEEAIGQLDGSTFVITSRYAGYRGDARLAGRFLELHVKHVEEAAARRFIGAWYRAVESQAELDRDAEQAEHLAAESAADLEQKVFKPDDRTRSLRDLARNPLMLQILCLVHRDRKQLPERRVELYRECVAVLLELWRRGKGLPIDVDTQQALRLLQPLAYRLHNAEKREAHVAELLPHLEAPLLELGRDPAEGERLLEAIRDQSGVLVSLGQGQFGFLHLSFQEYLAALHVQDRHASEPEILRQLAEHFGDPWWREVILLALGLNNPSLFEPLMTALLAAGVLPRDVALADHCLTDALVTTPRPIVRALAGGIEDDDPRYHALRLLRSLAGWQTVETGESNGRQVVERLARSDPSREVRSLATELLGGELPAVTERRAAPSVIVPGVRERVNEKDGSVLVFVPEGEYTLGTDDDLEAYLEKFRHWPKPRHRVGLDAFWIGKYPVTNGQFRLFLEARPGYGEPKFWDDDQFNAPDQPVVGVGWLDAMAYCRWAGLELPSEAQWEAAARGTDGRTYPWGDDEPSSELANFESTVGTTTPVGAYPRGVGPFGTHDQAGNVWEWCRDVFDERAYVDRDGMRDPLLSGKDDEDRTAVRVVRGGAWYGPAGCLASAFRCGDRAGSRYRGGGFRVLSRSRPEP